MSSPVASDSSLPPPLEPADSAVKSTAAIVPARRAATAAAKRLATAQPDGYSSSDSDSADPKMQRFGRAVRSMAAVSSSSTRRAVQPAAAVASRKLYQTTPAKSNTAAKPAARKKPAKATHSEFYAEALRAAEEYEAMQAAKPQEAVEIISDDDEQQPNMNTASTDVSAHEQSDDNTSVYSAAAAEQRAASESESEYSGSEASAAASEASEEEDSPPTPPPVKRKPAARKPAKAKAATKAKASAAADESDNASEVTATTSVAESDATTPSVATETVDSAGDDTPAAKPKRQRKKAKKEDGETAEKPVKMPRVAKKDIPTVENTKWYPTQELIDAGDALDRSGMRIGFPCMHTLLCTPAHTFRLASYTPERFRLTVHQNLWCMREIMRYSVMKGCKFFRMGSGLIPFASHPVLDVNWQQEFAEPLREIGDFCNEHGLRLSFHPDQFCLINAVDEEIVERSIWELQWHADFFDSLGMGSDSKMQIHVGGVYGNKEAAMERFCYVYNNRLSDQIRKRLVIENDDRMFTVKDCLWLNAHTKRNFVPESHQGIPILWDNLHHACLHNGEPLLQAMEACLNTWWEPFDGRPLTDYSSQDLDKTHHLGAHTENVDDIHFEAYMRYTKHLNFDVMLEIKNKDRSALLAVPIAAKVRAGVDIDFTQFKPKPVIIEQEDGTRIEVFKVDEIKNKKKEVGKLEQNRLKKQAEQEAKKAALERGEDFDLEAFREQVKVNNRIKGNEKRSKTAARQAAIAAGFTEDDDQFDAITVKLEEAEIRKQAELREIAIRNCDVERAGVTQELYDSKSATSKLKAQIQADARQAAKQAKQAEAAANKPPKKAKQPRVKTHEEEVSDGEADFHNATADLDVRPKQKPAPKRKAAKKKAVVESDMEDEDDESDRSSEEENYDDDETSASDFSEQSEHSEDEKPQAKAKLQKKQLAKKPTKATPPKTTKKPLQVKQENADDHSALQTPPVKRKRASAAA